MDKKIIASAIVIGVLTIGSINSINAATADPGSNADPVVSQSYVDGKIKEVMSMINGTSSSSSSSNNLSEQAIIDNVIKQIEAMNGTGTGTAATFKAVSVPAGSVFLGGEGCEVILRSGTATAFVAGESGITNVTSGKELLNGVTIATDNLLIIPRDDGRGFNAVTDVWILVKGSYDIM